MLRKHLSWLNIYIVITSLLSLLLAVYYGYELIMNQEAMVNSIGINLVGAVVFLITAILILILIFTEIVKKKVVVIYFSLTVIVLFSYDYILPNEWSDSVGNRRVAIAYNEIGVQKFVKNYHYLGISFLRSDSTYNESLNEFLENYSPLLPIKTPSTPTDLELESVRLSRIAKHPPTWFIIMGSWQKIFGGSDFSFKLLIKIITLLYYLSAFIVLKSLYEKANNKQILQILTVFAFLPTFLMQSLVPKTDILLGLISIWILYFLMKNRSSKININDLIVGLVFSAAILTKFTSIIIVIPIIVFYLIKYSYKSVPKLCVAGISTLIIPLILYLIFDYNVLLNILTGKAEQTIKVDERVPSAIGYIIDIVLYGQFRVGIPYVILMLVFIFKRQVISEKNYSIALMFLAFVFSVFFILWGSNIPRHIIGFIPFTLLLLVYIHRNFQDSRKLFLYTNILLLINIVLSIINRYSYINMLKDISNLVY